MKLRSIPLAISIFIILFGGIGLSTALNWWQTESSKIPARYVEGEAAGEFNPADIRGSYSFGDINKNFGIPLEDLQTAFRLPAGGDVSAFQVKSLEDLYADLPVEMGTVAVRLFTAFYNGLPYDLAANTDTFLFPEAAAVLNSNGNMTPDQADFLVAHTFTDDLPLPETTAPEPTPEEQVAPEPSATEHVAPEGSVTGKTTFQDLIDWGVKKEAIEETLGEAIPEPTMIIKDFATSKGLEFSTLKTNLQALLDAPSN